ncbi:hypothetical protein Ancab_033648 [Ancistrocladus abbreviatus]
MLNQRSPKPHKVMVAHLTLKLLSHLLHVPRALAHENYVGCVNLVVSSWFMGINYSVVYLGRGACSRFLSTPTKNDYSLKRLCDCRACLCGNCFTLQIHVR